MPDRRRGEKQCDLGPCDYLDIFRARDVETATKVSTLVRTFGHAHTEIWTATEWDRFKEIVRGLENKSHRAAVGAAGFRMSACGKAKNSTLVGSVKAIRSPLAHMVSGKPPRNVLRAFGNLAVRQGSERCCLALQKSKIQAAGVLNRVPFQSLDESCRLVRRRYLRKLKGLWNLGLRAFLPRARLLQSLSRSAAVRLPCCGRAGARGRHARCAGSARSGQGCRCQGRARSGSAGPRR